MPVQIKEKNLEEDIESFLCSPAGGFDSSDGTTDAVAVSLLACGWLSQVR